MNESKLPPLFRHQAQFLDSWLHASHRYTAMLWPAGAGAIALICTLIERLDSLQRVLVVADRNELVQQFIYRQQSTGISACAVDRYTYRQLQSEVDADSLNWRGNQVYALTSSLALQPDVAFNIQRQTWDLLIFLDTTSSATAKMVDGLAINAARVLWKLRPGSDRFSLDSTIWAIDHLTVGELIHDRGLGKGEAPSVVIRIHTGELSVSELLVARLVDELVKATKGTSAERLAASLQTRWLSSPAALESGLRRLESELSTQWPLWDASAEDTERDLPPETDSFGRGDFSVALRIVKECIGALDGLHSDPKLDSLLDHLRNRDPKESIAVFVRYRDTGAYLHAALEDERVPCVLVHGAMPASEVSSRIDRFLQESGQVLVMTTAMLIGTDLRNVRNLVLFDVPASREAMSHLLARFHLIGLPQLRVTVIADHQTATKTVDLIAQAGQFVA
jgi:hypothetical protein